MHENTAWLAGENSPNSLSDYNTYSSHKALSEAFKREAPGRSENWLNTVGEITGAQQTQNWVRLAHTHQPSLVQYDDVGKRIDEIVFHDAWHSLMNMGIESKAHSLAWTDASAGAEVERAALFYQLAEVEQSILCPIGMTHSCVPALADHSKLEEVWRPLVTSSNYDSRGIPAHEKEGALLVMGLSEQAAGTDLRNLKTIATALNADGEYLLNGCKWFFSAPQADASFVLAKTAVGISCFFVPRIRPDGRRNNIFIHRLKDKLGDRANASSEIELRDAWGLLVGEDGGGLKVIFKMIQNTRFDVGIGSSGMMHQACTQAIHYASQRSAFGKTIRTLPLMENVLADISLESEASTVLTMRIARDVDSAKRGESSGAFSRLAIALNKYWNCKRCPGLIFEAMEVCGGNGYIESSPFPRLYKQAPLNSIWEGSGNVLCLDVLRAISKDPSSYDAVLEEICLAKGYSSYFDKQVDVLQGFQSKMLKESMARVFTQHLTLTLQASLLIQHAPSYVADAFCRSRLGSDCSGAYGSLPEECNYVDIINRASANG